MAYCIMQIKKIKTWGQLSAAYNHNYRVSVPENAVPEKTVFNKELFPMANDTYNDTLKAFLENLGYGHDKHLRKNAVLALEILVTFSHDAQSNIDIDKWLRDNLAWVRNNFNTCPDKYGDNVLSAVYHADEATDHCHILCACADDKGSQNASYYIDGREKMQKLQDSYAEVMKVNHNLERGTRYSPLKHQDIQRMYGRLNEALSINDIPKWEEKDAPERYQEKVLEYTKDKIAVFHKQLEDKQRELEKAKAAPKMETIALEKQLGSAKRKIYKLEKEKEEFEREFGPVEKAKRQLDNVRLMKEALKDMDVDKANEFVDQLNEMVTRQRRIERAKAEENKKRKKNVFEKIQ